jgi:hypothetical protein
MVTDAGEPPGDGRGDAGGEPHHKLGYPELEPRRPQDEVRDGDLEPQQLEPQPEAAQAALDKKLADSSATYRIEREAIRLRRLRWSPSQRKAPREGRVPMTEMPSASDETLQPYEWRKPKRETRSVLEPLLRLFRKKGG